jgi:hypothetical protein
MHSKYAILSRLRSIDGFIILWNITFQDIYNANFKEGLLEMLEPIPKHITKNIQNNLSNDILPKKRTNI